MSEDFDSSLIEKVTLFLKNRRAVIFTYFEVWKEYKTILLQKGLLAMI